MSQCAVFLLFNDYVKDSSGNVILSPQNKNIYLNLNEKILNLINKKDWNDALFHNSILKSEINNNYFGLSKYEIIVTKRFFSAKVLDDENDVSYRKTILGLLPVYERELLKYSNNSFERNIIIKNLYKKFKKKCFSWRGYWCNKKLFFGENGPEFKLKLINHYTRNFMKPILVPILDINYYLPHFSGKFDINQLFKKSEEKNLEIKMDIDKILKVNEQAKTTTKNVKKSFEHGTNNQENYLRKIYQKNNPILEKKLTNITNKLDFGKEEEFTFIRKGKKIKQKLYIDYFLCCIVKTSHHIKGVCFIDDSELNFKVFFNQKTGTAMRGVKIGFTDGDDDYDKERKTCYGSYFIFHHKDKDLYKISINYQDIKMILRRKYYYKNTGLEIFPYPNIFLKLSLFSRKSSTI